MTTHVTLRRVSLDDLDFLLELRARPNVRRYQPIKQLDRDSLRRQIAERATAQLDPSFAGSAQWMIDWQGVPAGWVTLTVQSREHHTGATGYTVADEYRGHRIASSALRALLPIAFDPHGVALERIEAVAAVNNIASQRVLLRVGFQDEGIARGLLIIDGVRVDHVRFAVLRTDWLAQPPTAVQSTATGSNAETERSSASN